MSPLTAFQNLWAVARRDGLAAACRSIRHRASERYYERYFGVRTAVGVNAGELGFSDPGCKDYAANDYAGLFSVLRKLAPKPDDTLLDYGCGRGRVLLAAATFPFRRVLGVELSGTLVAEARANLRHAAHRFRCGATEVIHAPADAYVVPADVTIAYFFNSFSGPILAQTIARLRESVRLTPRPFRFVGRFPARCASEIEIGRVPDLALIGSHDRAADDRYRIYRFRP